MTKFDIIPLSDALGAEIRGLDLREKLDAETISAVEQAWYDHIVLAFRDQDLTIEQQRAFASQLGSLAPRGGEGGTKHEQAISENVMLVTNIRENGKPIGTLPDGEMMFHSDTPYFETPRKATLLYGIDIPSRGGETLFSNSYKVAETLPEEIKHKLAGKKAMQIYDYGAQEKTEDTYDFDIHPHYAHPIFRKHPETGRTSLFISELMTVEILDLPKDESRDLLAFLFAHQAREEFVYAHAWRPGDLVIWDNRCSVHARNDFPSDERRLLRRLVLHDEHPVLAGEPPYREAAAQ
ncbi:MAG: TauD/TfdA family dioxygenase [Rhodospirillaceae bacterium]|jgi:taurine dioxygenase|nr:TauD/TfdA family dioxygenase [Rhodospirillaceae bacterium]